MLKKLSVSLIGLLCGLNITLAQPVVADGGGDGFAGFKVKDELTEEQRAAIIKTLRHNAAKLRSLGKLPPQVKTTATLFAWPLKQALNFNDRGYYGISNYVDQNPAFPNQILDYNCGTRTYDNSAGYNHRGTDMFTWPFFWNKMQLNAVEVIAAAPGNILGKTDGNFDQNCATCPSACDWNAVYIKHDDGSVAWYGHLKTGSLTTKPLGSRVETGEYLGVVGSSGNSTAPHLHFEVWLDENYLQLIDPWNGPCNSMSPGGWWQNQQAYYTSTLMKTMVHGSEPVMSNCSPGSENSNEKFNFVNGQNLYLAAYYRDQQLGDVTNFTIYRPDNVVQEAWTHMPTAVFPVTWWYFIKPLPVLAMPGNWRFEAVYKGQRSVSWFTVNAAPVMICPNTYNSLHANISGSNFRWQVNDGSGFINISDNSLYGGTTTNKLQLKSLPSTYYGYQYRCLVDGTLTSHVIPIKFVSYWLGMSNSSWNNPSNWTCGNIPDENTDVVVQTGGSYFPEVSSNTSCRTVTVNPGATLTVNPGVNLNITK